MKKRSSTPAFALTAAAAAFLFLAIAMAQEEPVCLATDPKTCLPANPVLQWGPDDAARPPGYHVDHTPVTGRTPQTMDEYMVGGVNVATYQYDPNHHPTTPPNKPNTEEEPYELYDSFDIADQIRGNESWWDMIRYRQLMQRPTNSFYYDKVALKRWLPTIGLPVPRSFALNYSTELTSTGDLEDEFEVIFDLLPKERDYAAKPSHMSFTKGVWLVNYDYEKNVTYLSKNAAFELKEGEFDPEEVASSLTISLHKKPLEYESWTLHNVKPGIVIEERFSELGCPTCPPVEFNIFVIWGRVWVSELNYVEGKGRWCGGYIHRNGTMVAGSNDDLPLKYWLKWLDYPKVVAMAEKLGAHKDMLRVDVFVGVANGLDKREAPETQEERVSKLNYVISEVSFHPTTVFADHELREEGARLWIAGYKMGNYKTVPNTEVPQIYLDTGRYPLEGTCASSE